LPVQLRDFLLVSRYCETDGFPESHDPKLIQQTRLTLRDSGLLGFVSGLDVREWQCPQRPVGEVGRRGSEKAERLKEAQGKRRRSSWPILTFPATQTRPEKVYVDAP
jgi:hypothetical protein